MDAYRFQKSTRCHPNGSGPSAAGHSGSDRSINLKLVKTSTSTVIACVHPSEEKKIRGNLKSSVTLLNVNERCKILINILEANKKKQSVRLFIVLITDKGSVLILEQNPPSSGKNSHLKNRRKVPSTMQVAQTKSRPVSRHPRSKRVGTSDETGTDRNNPL